MKEVIDLEPFLTWLSKNMERVPPHLAERNQFILSFNQAGKNVPIYWCFNSWAEAILLARQLGPDQPLHAMHSLQTFVDDVQTKIAHTLPLGVLYGNNLLEVHSAGSIVIGGNCQAAPLAEAIAHFLMSRSECLPILMSMEHQPFYSYPGNVVMLFGARSEIYNPFLSGEDPIPKWKRQFARPSWGIMNGGHGEYFMEPAVFDLVAYLNAVTEACVNGKPISGPLKLDELQGAATIKLDVSCK